MSRYKELATILDGNKVIGFLVYKEAADIVQKVSIEEMKEICKYSDCDTLAVDGNGELVPRLDDIIKDELKQRKIKDKSFNNMTMQDFIKYDYKYGKEIMTENGLLLTASSLLKIPSGYTLSIQAYGDLRELVDLMKQYRNMANVIQRPRLRYGRNCITFPCPIIPGAPEQMFNLETFRNLTVRPRWQRLGNIKNEMKAHAEFVVSNLHGAQKLMFKVPKDEKIYSYVHSVMVSMS